MSMFLDGIKAAREAGHVNLHGDAKREVLEFSASSKEEKERHASSMQNFEIKKRARSMVVPTAVEEVKAMLRQRRQPITLFGEGPYDRRERLREVEADQADDKLRRARQDFASYSFERASARLDARRALYADPGAVQAEQVRVAATYAELKGAQLQASSTPESRPLVKLQCAPRLNVLATGSLGTYATVWALGADTSLQPRAALLKKGHDERLLSVAWHPEAFGAADSACLLASTGADGRCLLWDCRSAAPVASLLGHRGAVTDCAHHPLGKHVVTSGADYSWRLWDIETATSLLLQDGHVKECSAVALHRDGSLAMTCDAGGVVLVWDLRSGQRVSSFSGHVEKVTSCCFSSNGFSGATASVDNTVRIWDLRYRRCSYMIPAHSNAISSVRYSSCGEVLLSSSFDATVKLWATRDHSLLRTLSGHSGKVMAADFNADGDRVLSAGFDRTVKLWG
eukprot:GSChrysophyteH1.ASY1.ANO1.367.1 assembled CDS